MAGKYFLDSNIILYALGNDVSKKKIAQGLINKDAIISTQVLTEVAQVCLQKFVLTHAVVEAWIVLLNTETHVELISSDLICEAINISRATQYGFYDSLIVATAQHSGVDTLYSEDMQHGRNVQHLQIINPFL